MYNTGKNTTVTSVILILIKANATGWSIMKKFLLLAVKALMNKPTEGEIYHIRKKDSGLIGFEIYY